MKLQLNSHELLALHDFLQMSIVDVSSDFARMPCDDNLLTSEQLVHGICERVRAAILGTLTNAEIAKQLEAVEREQIRLDALEDKKKLCDDDDDKKVTQPRRSSVTLDALLDEARRQKEPQHKQ